MIIDGKNYPRDSVLDDQLVAIPDRLKKHVEYDSENKSGVLLLLDLAFMSSPKLDSSGTPTSYPHHVMAGEVFDLGQLPESVREGLREGEHFKSNWSFEDQSKVRREASEAYLAQFQNEPEPAVQAAWRNR